MGLRINTNIASLVAQRNLATVSDKIAGHFRRLSTGLRIATAADDPAGLAMSERLRAQVRSLEQARRNAQDGISMVQTGEGALNEVSSILIRMRELAIQSGNGTVSSADRVTLQQEFGELVDEIDRIARSAEFNGIKLLDGTATTIVFQIGGGTSDFDRVSASLGSVRASALALATQNITSLGAVSTAMGVIDEAIDSVLGLRGRFGSMHNRLESAIRYLGVQVENLSAAESRIRDVDVAYETAQLVKAQILQQATISVLAQANSQPQLALRLLTGN